jgi:LuxR family maltose regulon positive regulatory protein
LQDYCEEGFRSLRRSSQGLSSISALNLVRALLASGRIGEAARVLVESDLSEERIPLAYFKVIFRLVKAQLFWLRGNHAGALAMLGLALSRAEQGCFLQVFANEGKLMRDMLDSFASSTRLLEKEPTPFSSYVHKVEQYCTSYHQRFGLQARELVDDWGISVSLSKSELRVLDMLIQGNSLRNISDKLYISYNTVRSHLQRIYNKLGVHSRSEAVSLGKTLFWNE